MNKGKFFSMIAIILLAFFVLFGVSDPVDIYNGFVKIIQNLSEKGEWVKSLWASISEGDMKSIWELIKDSFFNFGNSPIGVIIGGLFK